MSLQAKTVSMSGMRLQDVLKDVEPLVAFPVRRLRGENFDAGASLHRLAETLHPRVAGLVAGDSFEDGDLGLAARGLDQVLANQLAAAKVIGPDEARGLDAGVGRGFPVEPGIDDHHRDVGLVGLADGRHHLAGS